VLVSSSDEWIPFALHDLVLFLPLQSGFGWCLADLRAAWRCTNPILACSPVVRLDFCLSARDQQPAEVRAGFIFPVILGCLLCWPPVLHWVDLSFVLGRSAGFV